MIGYLIGGSFFRGVPGGELSVGVGEGLHTLQTYFQEFLTLETTPLLRVLFSNFSNLFLSDQSSSTIRSIQSYSLLSQDYSQFYTSVSYSMNLSIYLPIN